MDSEGQKQPQGEPQSDSRRHAAPGAQLAAGREAMGLSIEQVADQLKLAPRQVVALEQGDYASLPNMAVTRGFIRAYAKVVRLDPAPLVAQIEVAPAVVNTEHAPIRREKIPASFSSSRFPTLASRQSKPKGWIIGGVVVLAVVAAAGAWQAGLITLPAFHKTASTEVPATVAGTASTTPSAPIQTNVPLVQPPASPDNTAPLVTGPATPLVTGTPAEPAAVPATTPAAAPAATTPAVTPPAPAAATPAAATSGAPGANTLTLTFEEDSWVEIRRPGTSSLISRLVKAGSTETFEIDRQATLIVGKPDGVRATLRGQPLALPKVANGTISRVQIK
ncbi:cytoskeleton protein RodZ [Pseudoduganella lurida]|uniref:Cytoskeleton protein RodZ n=1 Tax=Pseudoduganella lurida TaxID=1036180 RepID=A0A562RBH8_9BURK|nr:helix-turn-helix domain-containing protein [Pseudoduganella lurida]TWI66407.1 cytoskeleton protein RodZ [Pseudoduganella lurida]